MVRRALIWGGIAAGVALVALGIRMAVKRIDALEAQLADASRKAAVLERQVRQQVKLTRMTAESAAAARAADAAASEAGAREQAEAARALAEQEVRRAKEQEAMSREELAAVRQRRDRELDRMREALGRIAPTRRTPSGMVVELANDSFHFDFDRADLRPENRELLSRIAGVLLASEGFRLHIYGHTDDAGPAEYNQSLSERRARSVRDYLARAGLPGELMQVEGFGKTNPRVTNATPAGRQKNRRVEIGIVDSIIQYRGSR